MQFNAVVLGGGRLGSISCEGLAPFRGRPLISASLEAVREHQPTQTKIVCQQAPTISLEPNEELISPAGIKGAWLSLVAGLHPFVGSQLPVLVVCGDLPFIRPDNLDFFAEQEPSGLHCALVTREGHEQRFPNRKRSYIHLLEGDFLLAQAFMLSPDLISEVNLALLHKQAGLFSHKLVYALKIIMSVGLTNILRLRPDNFPLPLPKLKEKNKFTITELQEKFTSLSGIPVRVSLIETPELVYDIDGIRQLEKAHLIPSEDKPTVGVPRCSACGGNRDPDISLFYIKSSGEPTT